MVLLIVNYVFIHEFINFVKVEKRHHWVAVVLSVKVGIPQKGANDNVRAHTASVSKTVGNLGNFAVRVLEIAEIIHNGISQKDRRDPPKYKVVSDLLGLASRNSAGGVKCKLHQSGALKFL